MRVNARLDDEAAEQIDYLTRATGRGVSHVLRESVALYYGQVRAQRGGPAHLGALVGKGDSGRSDIASDVKRRLGDSPDKKIGHGKR
jgi:Ribbon-helix-helix protein, copG family